jgi:hypothetical protein
MGTGDREIEGQNVDGTKGSLHELPSPLTSGGVVGSMNAVK